MSSARPEHIPEKLGGAPHSKCSLRLWLRLLSCALVIEKRIRNRLAADFSTTLPRFDVLAALERSPAGLTMSELSHSIMVSNGNVTGVVVRLITDGLVKRKGTELDRRVVRVALTPKGRESFQRMARVHEQWVDRMFADLSEARIAELSNQLAELRRSVERNPL